MKRNSKTAALVSMGGLVALLAGAALFVTQSPLFERTPPRIDSAATIEWNLQEPLHVSISDESGLRHLKATLSDGNHTMVVQEQRFDQPVQNTQLEIAFPKNGFGVGKKNFELILEATDASQWNLFKGNSQKTLSRIRVDTLRPDVRLISHAYKIMRGGAASVIFKATDEAMEHFYVETNFGKRFYATPFAKEGYYIALVAWPTQEKQFHASIVAKDKAGNLTKVSIPYFLQDRKYKDSTIALHDRFLEGKISDLIAQIAPEQMSLAPLERFKYVNETMRQSNEALILKVTSAVPASPVSHFMLKPFYPLKNGKVVATFGDHRFYEYNKQPVSESYHLGLDLASNANAPMQTSNDGVVVLARENGIYGNNIIIDHGLGVYSLYGHCTTMHVKEGDVVKTGDTIATTGVTGLALGDHLHFGMYVQGVDVRPEEWMDLNWLKNTFTSVIDAAHKAI